MVPTAGLAGFSAAWAEARPGSDARRQTERTPWSVRMDRCMSFPPAGVSPKRCRAPDNLRVPGQARPVEPIRGPGLREGTLADRGSDATGPGTNRHPGAAGRPEFWFRRVAVAADTF